MAKTDRDKKGVEEKPSNRKKRATLKPTKPEKYKRNYDIEGRFPSNIEMGIYDD